MKVLRLFGSTQESGQDVLNDIERGLATERNDAPHFPWASTALCLDCERAFDAAGRSTAPCCGGTAWVFATSFRRRNRFAGGAR